MSILAQLTTDERRKVAVWIKGIPIPSMDATSWRYDAFGHIISFPDYGDRNSAYGWEIDHIIPRAMGGSDDITNLRPLHCVRNASLGGTLGGMFKR